MSGRQWRISARRAIAGGVLLPFAVMTSGCSFFASSGQNLSVVSDPPGARVVVNGNQAGITPLQYNIRRNEETMVQVSKAGFETASRQTNQSLSTVGVVDVIGGCIILLPFLGLISPGAWKQEPANLSFNLIEKEPAQPDE